MYFSFKSWTDYILIIKFKISSILIGLKNSFFSTKALAKVYQNVSYRTVQ